MLPGEKKFDKIEIRGHTISNIDEDIYNEILYLNVNCRDVLLTRYHDDNKGSIMTDYRYYTVYDVDKKLLVSTQPYIDELRHKTLNMRYVISELTKYFEDRNNNKHPLFLHYRKSKNMIVKPGYVVIALYKNKNDEDMFKCTYIDYADIQMLTGMLKYHSDFLKEKIKNVKITDVDNERNVALMTLSSVQENVIPNDNEKTFTDRFVFNLDGFRRLFKLNREIKITGIYFGYVKQFNEYSLPLDYYDYEFRGLPGSCLMFNFLFSDKFGIYYPEDEDD